jgi:hypothetical protein
MQKYSCLALMPNVTLIVNNILFGSQVLMRSQLFEGLKCESQIENDEKGGSQGTLLGL